MEEMELGDLWLSIRVCVEGKESSVMIMPLALQVKTSIWPGVLNSTSCFMPPAARRSRIKNLSSTKHKITIILRAERPRERWRKKMMGIHPTWSKRVANRFNDAMIPPFGPNPYSVCNPQSLISMPAANGTCCHFWLILTHTLRTTDSWWYTCVTAGSRFT